MTSRQESTQGSEGCKGQCPFSGQKPLWLKNAATNQELYDTLHSSTSELVKCGDDACIGSLMIGQSSRRYANKMRPKQEVWEHAQTFLKQYYEHLDGSTQAELEARLKQVESEIEQNDTYELTLDELTFGAKVAWRNSARCIARILWNNLELFDCRHVTTTQEMFDALMKHTEWATNNGNIRTGITIFPQRQKGRDDFRLWNAQFVQYAGYRMKDGSVVGDAGKITFTKVCQNMGWKGEGTPYDVVPIILSAPGETKPAMYNVPSELIMEVPLTHPHYSWFGEMGLRWYALPAVADMMLDVGGVQFTCAPFNGWYTGAEIGSRNFLDTNRYNMLEKFAEKMGLDTSATDSLWKDRVNVQVNIAVLHSFQKHGVSIVDHHTAAESFQKFMEQEQRERGGCNADWVWLVPPMSSSSVPTYHQDMLNYNMKPSFEYQDKIWDVYPHLLEDGHQDDDENDSHAQ